jgi:imidazolonepropionase-like amidohydrolase
MLLAGCLLGGKLAAQETFPVNGVADKRDGCYAFIHATIVKDGNTTLPDATLLVRKGKIIGIGADIQVPAYAVTIDCKGKYIYPSFIDVYTDYGVNTPQRERTGGDFRAPAQLTSNQKGAYGWNQAIHTDINAAALFTVEETKAKGLRDAGFGTVLSHQKDGIARGTGVLATLAGNRENLVIIKEKAAAHYSFNKGTSTQSYPGSIMGSIALLRQTYLDAQWYKSRPVTEGTNLSLAAWNDAQSLVSIFEATDKWTVLRADRIGDEFGVQYVIKAGGNEYQRLKEIKATNATFILPLNYPQAMDVEDPNDARFVSLADLKHWEMAPAEAGLFEKEGIPFCLTSADLKDPKQFLPNLRKAIEYGLSENRALEALTKIPATLLGVYDKVGSLETGKLANFLITSGPVFKENTTVFQNWVQGMLYEVKNEGWDDITGTYNLSVTSAASGTKNYTLLVKSENAASILAGDTLTTRFNYDGKLVRINFSESKKAKAGIRLSGVNNAGTWQGNGTDSTGNNILWTAGFVKSG